MPQQGRAHVGRPGGGQPVRLAGQVVEDAGQVAQSYGTSRTASVQAKQASKSGVRGRLPSTAPPAVA